MPKPQNMPPDFRKDIPSILLLLLLYVLVYTYSDSATVLQGIPLGLISAVPMILTNRKVSYTDQAMFSFAIWPFSLKLLWAPIVDALYFERFGRRKTWLIPMQYLIGLFMLILSVQIDDLMDSLNIKLITAVFFMLNFLAATQDIAVDGWALTMLRRENVAYASTCNAVGQTAGYFLGYVVFLALESPDFCNNYLRSVPSTTGLVTLSGFLYFWAWIFLFTTTAVTFLKRELPEKDLETSRLSVAKSYSLLWDIVNLQSVKSLVLFTLTSKIGFAAADAVTALKLVEVGVPKDRLALLAVPMTPLQILLPFFIAKYTAGSTPMSYFVKAVPVRLLFGFVYAAIVWFTPNFKLADGTFPFSYYVGIVFIFAIHQVALYFMYVASMSFFAKISDPAVGGTYMTLLNTVSNLGGNWPSTVALWLVDPLTSKECSISASNKCSDSELSQVCTKNGGQCITILDGYYIETTICIIIGFIWFYAWGRKTILGLQASPDSSWRVLSYTSLRRDD